MVGFYLRALTWCRRRGRHRVQESLVLGSLYRQHMDTNRRPLV